MNKDNYEIRNCPYEILFFVGEPLRTLFLGLVQKYNYIFDYP